MRFAGSLLLILAMTGCAENVAMKPIEFLTRSGCVQTKVMRDRVEGVRKDLALPNPYSVVDLDTLLATDVRRAYPTPTVLLGGADLFGMEEPKPPYPEPT